MSTLKELIGEITSSFSIVEMPRKKCKADRNPAYWSLRSALPFFEHFITLML